MRNTRVATVQMQHAPGDKEANLATIGREMDTRSVRFEYGSHS